ncbi:MAG TPA: DUF1579 domain-containing protein [Flavobacterium sp.]|nr:DUF1579 domain-containing protein [Flavobacterium sp.]
MKKMTFAIAALLMMATACKKAEDKAVDTAASATDTTAVVKDETPAAPMDSVAMQKAWEAYATPGPAHKMLAMDNGTWDEESTMWMSANDTKPTKAKMVGTSKMILGGRYQEMRHTGNFMGMPFEGIGTMGYDNASKKLVSSWVDNMGTGIMYMSGAYDGTSKKMELSGDCTDPMTGKTKSVRETYEIIDDNTRKMEMYETSGGQKEFKTMEITMTRKK